MNKKIISFFVFLVICIIGIVAYFIYFTESSDQDESDKVDMSKMYSIPNSNMQEANQKRVIQSNTKQSSQIVPENDSINKKPLTVQEKKTNIVNKSFITTSKDIATF